MSHNETKAKAELELVQLHNVTPFIVAADEDMKVTWASNAILRRVEHAVGMKVSELIEFREPRQQCSTTSLSVKLGEWCKLALLSDNSTIPLTGQWISVRNGFLVLATPDVRIAEDLDPFSFDDFQVDDRFVDLLVARDESVRSLEEASSAAKELKKKNKDLDESRRHLESINATLAREIADRKRADENLLKAKEEAEKAKEAAEDANKAKDQFLANVSHEVRTPLNAIIGFAEGIIESDSIETAHSCAQTVLNESDHLLTLINEILDHAKMEAGKVDIEYHSFDMSRLLESVISFAHALIKENGLRFHLSVDDGVPQYIKADFLRLRQILMNLVSNAVKFTEKGSITIRVELLKANESHSNLRFSVIDTGVGIPKNKQAAIFESFTQADGSTTRKFGGTGLGTSICKKLVELMGGQIGLQSEPGKGSTFWFTIPFDSCDAPSKDEELALPTENYACEPENTRQARILVAEDYEPNQDVMKMHLGNAGHILDIAEDGKQAVVMCAENCYDLILMDVQMPEMDGLDATRCIRSGNSPCRDIPIIGLTASAEGRIRQACVEAGMNDVFIKPIRRKPLLNAINKWLSRSNEDLQPGSDTNLSNTEGVTKQTDAAPLDFEEAVREFGGNRELFNTVIGKFLDKAESQIQLLKEALEKQDSETLRKEAHKIRGGAGNLTAMQLAMAAERLEKLAQSGKLDEAAEQLAQLEKEFDRLRQFV